MSSTCQMSGPQGCGSCDRCLDYKRRQAAAEAERQEKRQSIHLEKLAALQRLTLEGKNSKAQRRAKKAREKMCRTTPPRGHVYEENVCVGCGIRKRGLLS